MHNRTAFVDDPALAREFNSGDVVRKSGIRDFVLSPYAGRVLYSNADTGKVQVQWPWGVEEESASGLVRDISGDYAPPVVLDQSYSTWESSRNVNGKDVVEADAKWRSSLASRLVDTYEERTKPIWREACLSWHNAENEVDAFVRISSQLASTFGHEAVRITVANLYGLGQRLAIYWADPKRRYKTTQKERASGIIYCPRCKGQLKPRIYRQGRKIFQCKACGFSIFPTDIKHK